MSTTATIDDEHAEKLENLGEGIAHLAHRIQDRDYDDVAELDGMLNDIGYDAARVQSKADGLIDYLWNQYGPKLEGAHGLTD